MRRWRATGRTPRFFLASGALGAPGTSVAVTGLDADSVQRDREIAACLARFGACVMASDGGVRIAPGRLTGQRIDVDQIPDLLPVLAVLACAAEGETVLFNAARLRDKESDRLASTAAMSPARSAATCGRSRTRCALWAPDV